MIEKKQPLITVITVVLNGAEVLEKAFESVFSQSFTDFEYIVVDGGSIDGSVDIIKKYEKNIDYWVSEPDNGIYDAMNKAASLAKGRWILFLGADDVLYNVFHRVAEYLKDDKTIYYGDVFRPFANRRYDGKFSALKLSFRNICHQSIFYPKYTHEKYLYNLKYLFLSDYEFNMRCFADSIFSFSYIPVTVAIFNDNGGLSQSKKDISFHANKMELIKKHFPYYVYVIGIMRSFLINILTAFRIDKIAVSIHHLYLRIIRRLT